MKQPTFRTSCFLPRELRTVREARSHVVEAVRDWGIRLTVDTEDAISLVVSELVTNAVRYSQGPMVTVTACASPAERLLLIEVFDGSLLMPVVRSATPDDQNGRGMFLVETLALRHGAELTKRGKRVWAVLELPQQPDSTYRRAIARRIRSMTPRQPAAGQARSLQEQRTPGIAARSA